MFLFVAGYLHAVIFTHSCNEITAVMQSCF